MKGLFTLLHRAPSARRSDAALLVLRSAGALLAVTFGRQKVLSLIALLQAHGTLATWGLAGFMRTLGMPWPTLAAVGVAANESVIALLVAAGWWTRLAAASLAVEMTVAFAASMHLGEEPARAATYWLIAVTLILTGPGRHSLDHWRASRAAPGPTR